jgi:hypothetical protein
MYTDMMLVPQANFHFRKKGIGLTFKAYPFLYVTPGLNFINSKLCSLSVECFVRILEHTVASALYIIN